MIIALVGKPNSGKTAFFNQLTGGRQKVANYPGVTVERKEGLLDLGNGNTHTIMDLPGTYSLDVRSPDEAITRDVVFGRISNVCKPELLVCVVDATQLQINLRLVLELKQVGIPLVVVLNMSDLAHKLGYRFDYKRLSREIGFPVIPVVAVKKQGVYPFLNWLKTYALPPSLTLPHKGGGDKKVPPFEKEQCLVPPFEKGGLGGILTPDNLRELHQQAKHIARVSTVQQGSPSRITRIIDSWVLNPWAGMAILLSLLFIVFQAVFNLAVLPMNAIDAGLAVLRDGVATVVPTGLFRSLLLDGVLSGVGSILRFLPQILILFFFILILEDSGYMGRAAFLLDKLMGTVGLHGKAFIPLLSSFACAIPGIMATRTIDNKRARFTTIMMAPLMTCSARLPVYTLIISAFVPAKIVWGGVQLQGLVLFALYAIGIISALLVALVLKVFAKNKHREPLLMELPTYRWPNLKNLAIGLLERARIFLRRAGTIILALMILVWFLSVFPGAPAGATEPVIYYSFAGQLGRFLEPVFLPIGFNWQMVIALVPGMAAREVAVSALGTVYALSSTVGSGVAGSLASSLASQWTLASGLAFLAWYVFAPQCVATLAIVKRETNSWIWPTLMLAYLMVLAYGAAFMTYQVTNYVF